MTSTLFDYIQHNYTSTGSKTFTCLAKGVDGNESKSITFNVEGLEVKHYDILQTNISRRIIGFSATNAYQRLETNVSINTEETTFSQIANITTEENVLVFAEVNNTPGDDKTVNIRLTSGGEGANYGFVEKCFVVE